MAVMSMEEIYMAYHKKVMGYLSVRLSSRADAEDLCSEVFEKVQRKLPTYDQQKAAVGTRVFTITRNTLIDFFRRKKPQEELDENIAEDGEIDDSLLNAETLSELASALQALPQQLRDIVVLRYYDGKPLTEIAEMMGLSYGAVKLRHQNALLLLREKMLK